MEKQSVPYYALDIKNVLYVTEYLRKMNLYLKDVLVWCIVNERIIIFFKFLPQPSSLYKDFSL